MRSNSGVIDFWSQSDTTNKSNKLGTAVDQKIWRASSNRIFYKRSLKEEMFVSLMAKNGGSQRAPLEPQFRRPCKYKKEIPKVSYFKSYTLQKIQ